MCVLLGLLFNIQGTSSTSQCEFSPVVAIVAWLTGTRLYESHRPPCTCAVFATVEGSLNNTSPDTSQFEFSPVVAWLTYICSVRESTVEGSLNNTSPDAPRMY